MFSSPRNDAISQDAMAYSLNAMGRLTWKLRLYYIGWKYWSGSWAAQPPENKTPGFFSLPAGDQLEEMKAAGCAHVKVWLVNLNAGKRDIVTLVAYKKPPEHDAHTINLVSFDPLSREQSGRGRLGIDTVNQLDTRRLGYVRWQQNRGGKPIAF